VNVPGHVHHSCCTRRSGSATALPAETRQRHVYDRRLPQENRPHRAIGRRTPAQAFAARTKATPKNPPTPVTAEGHHRVRQDRIDKAGCVTLRYRSKLLHIGVGRVHAGVRVLLLVNDLDVRVITEDGELLRHLTLDPTKAYQATGRPKGPARS